MSSLCPLLYWLSQQEWPTKKKDSASYFLRAQRLKKNRSSLKISPSLAFFNLAWKFQSHLKFSILTFRIPHQKKAVWWVARLKLSISLGNFNPRGRSWILSFFGPLGLGTFGTFEMQVRSDGFDIVGGGAPKERRRRHAEKRSSKRVFLESPFLANAPLLLVCP